MKLRIRLLAALAAALSLCVAPAVSRAQDRQDRDERAAPEGAQIDPQTGKVCRPMCAEDMSPCDPPIVKAREGRCSSPSAGFVG